MDDASLMERLERIVDETGLSDPTEIAEKLLGGMGAQEREEFVRQNLRAWVRLNLGRLRKRLTRAHDKAKVSSAKRRTVLTKAERVERAIANRFAYNGVDWGVARDMTVGQVRELAAGYRRQANVLLDHETDWATLADEMDKHGVTLVRELPIDVLDKYFPLLKRAAA